MGELDKELNDLENSLTYQMSLGSRELFHSNIWAWLMKFDQRFINVFFSEYDEKIYTIVDGKIYREKDNFDIFFCCTQNDGSETKEIFILENKIKSFITIEQLSKYTEKINKDFNRDHYHAVYTGIKDSLTDEQKQNIKGTEWKFLSYADIGKGIKEVVKELQNELNTNTEKDMKKLDQCRLIDAYADSIASMANVLSETLDSSDQKFTYDVGSDEKEKQLEDLRLLDVYKKMKVADFSKYFRENYYDKIEKKKPNKYELNSWCGFSNKQAIFDVRFKREEPSTEQDTKGKPIYKSIFEIGIQIQGDSYRFACLTMKERGIAGKDQKETLFNKIVEHTKWFAEKVNDNEDCVHGVRLCNSKRYCSYEDKAANGYIFIYQYANIKDMFSGNITYEELSKRICRDLENAIDAIKLLQGAGLEKPKWLLTNNV